jgi:predicted RNase H-like HicB family nuclease
VKRTNLLWLKCQNSELAGCAADGETYLEALQNVQIVMQEWIETAHELGRSIPQPKGKLVYA